MSKPAALLGNCIYGIEIAKMHFKYVDQFVSMQAPRLVNDALEIQGGGTAQCKEES